MAIFKLFFVLFKLLIVIAQDIPNRCILWYDGCNTCKVGADGTISRCTEKFCRLRERPKCLVFGAPCDFQCPQNYDPVCGTNGKTYGNYCELKRAICLNKEIKKEHNGPCDNSLNPKGWCRASGDPHYHSFDGKLFDFMGNCQYLLAGSVGDENPKFTIEVQHRASWNNHVTMTEQVWVNFASKNEETEYSINLRIADPVNGNGYSSLIAVSISITINGITTTMNLNEMNNDDIALVNYGNRVELTTWFGLEVTYAASGWVVNIYVPYCYYSQIEGLCGNWNGFSEDDFTTSTGTTVTSVSKFGLSWQVNWIGDGKPDKCQGGPDEFPTCDNPHVVGICKEVIAFEQCVVAMGPELFEASVKNCIFDLCLDNSVKCGIFESFAQTCMRALGDKVQQDQSICRWAYETGCKPDCGPNSYFDPCADSCSDALTCGNYKTKECSGDRRRVSMCVCKQGYVLQDRQCIKSEDCGCTTDNGGSVANGFTQTDCDKSCSCTNGAYKCEAHAEGTCIEGIGCPCDACQSKCPVTRCKHGTTCKFDPKTCVTACVLCQDKCPLTRCKKGTRCKFDPKTCRTACVRNWSDFPLP